MNVEQIPTAKVARWLTTWKLREKKAGTRRETSSLIPNPRKDGRSSLDSGQSCPGIGYVCIVDKNKECFDETYIFSPYIYFDKESFIDIGLHTLHMFVQPVR